MADSGKADMAGSGERSNAIYPFKHKKGSVLPKEKKHVSTMIGEKIGKSILSIFKNNKKKKNPADNRD